MNTQPSPALAASHVNGQLRIGPLDGAPPVPNLDDEQPVLHKVLTGPAEYFADDLESFRPACERVSRLVAMFGRQGAHRGSAHVRRIRKNQVVALVLELGEETGRTSRIRPRSS